MERIQLCFKDIILILEFLIATFFYLTTKKLQKKLKDEQIKRTYPILSVSINTNEPAIYLENNSYCYAKEIKIEDTELVVDMGFKKHLLLKFKEIDLIKPHEKEKLTFSVYDGEYNITSAESNNLIHNFSTCLLALKISFNNIENVEFTETIENIKKEFVVKEIKPKEK